MTIFFLRSLVCFVCKPELPHPRSFVRRTVTSCSVSLIRRIVTVIQNMTAWLAAFLCVLQEHGFEFYSRRPMIAPQILGAFLSLPTRSLKFYRRLIEGLSLRFKCIYRYDIQFMKLFVSLQETEGKHTAKSKRL